MIRIFRFLPVALLTFVIGASSAVLTNRLVSFVLNNGRPLAATSGNCGAVNTDENPEITEPVDNEIYDFCELARDPARFHGKTVRIRAILGGNRHGSLIFGSHCDALSDRAGVFYYPPTMSETLYRLDSAGGIEDYPHPIEIVATGTFFKVKPSFYSDSNVHTTELQIELMEIESATRLP